MATDLFIEVANQRGIVSPSDRNPIVPPDISPPGTYSFNAYFLDIGSPDTYHRYAAAGILMNVYQKGPPTDGTFTFSFLGYATDDLDVNITNGNLLVAFLALRSVGQNNALLTGNAVDGWIVEFIGDRAGFDQPLIVVDASNAIPGGSAKVDKIQAGGNGVNCKQRIRLRQNLVAQTGAWTEINAGGPNFGWSGSLSTSGISPTFWESPTYNIVLEVELYTAGSRIGTDGVTTQAAARTGNNGVTSGDGRSRMGNDGVITAGSNKTGSDGEVKANSPGAYISGSANWVTSDIGRALQSLWVPSGTIITGLNGDQRALLSNNHTSTVDRHSLDWVAKGKIKAELTSATANFSSADIGHVVIGDNIPAGTTITAIQSSTKVTLSKTPTATGSGLHWEIVGVIFNTYDTATGNFTAADVGKSISGTNLQSGTTIATYVSATRVTLSKIPTAEGTGLSWTLTEPVSLIYTSATAAFTAGDVGRVLNSQLVPAQTTIAAYISATQVQLSQRPTGPGTGLSWTIINPNQAAPAITRIQTGNGSTPEIQRIIFPEIPDYGTFTLTLGGVTTAPIAGPLVVSDIASALNAAYPASASFIVTQYAKSIVDIQFGIVGSQSLFTINDSNLRYDPIVLSLVLVQGTGNPGGAGLPEASIIWDGDFSTAQPIGGVRIKQNTDGTKTVELRQRYMQLRANWVKKSLNSAGPMGSYLVDEDSMDDIGAGLIAWDRVYCTLPAARTERHQQSRAVILPARTYSGSNLIDIQLISLSISTWVDVYYTYHLGFPRTTPADGPAATVIHFTNGIFALLPFNGFDVNNGTYGRQFTQSWTRRLWRGDIYEQAIFFN